jgi:hypothetical protein
MNARSLRRGLAGGVMELIIAIMLLVALASLALRYGHDSRDGFPSKERDLARFGLRWTDAAPASEDAPGALHFQPSSREQGRRDSSSSPQ